MENQLSKDGARGVWNTPWNIRKSEYARRKPDGGFCFIPAMAILRVWRAYKDAIIRLYDLRVWLACFELVARRCEISPDRFRRYSFDEIHRLVDGADPRDIRAAVGRLSNAGLLTWSERRIIFPVIAVDAAVDEDPELATTLELVTNHRRKVPVPRRTLRFLARTSKPVLIATVVGHLLRCLYYRNGLCSPDGRCKASWIADVFGVDLRNVKAARRSLSLVGWLLFAESTQSTLNRWGPAVRVNLNWAGMGNSDGESPPRAPDARQKTPPPRNNRKLSSRLINQKPALSGRTGACSAPPAIATFANVSIEDLRNAARLESLFQEAQRRGWTSAGEAARLRFYAAAAHAMRVGQSNPPGLFVSIIRRGLWAFIAAVDEDLARCSLREYESRGSKFQEPAGAMSFGQGSAPAPVRTVICELLNQRWKLPLEALKRRAFTECEAVRLGE